MSNTQDLYAILRISSKIFKKILKIKGGYAYMIVAVIILAILLAVSIVIGYTKFQSAEKKGF